MLRSILWLLFLFTNLTFGEDSAILIYTGSCDESGCALSFGFNVPNCNFTQLVLSVAVRGDLGTASGGPAESEFVETISVNSIVVDRECGKVDGRHCEDNFFSCFENLNLLRHSINGPRIEIEVDADSNVGPGNCEGYTLEVESSLSYTCPTQTPTHRPSSNPSSRPSSHPSPKPSSNPSAIPTLSTPPPTRVPLLTLPPPRTPQPTDRPTPIQTSTPTAVPIGTLLSDAIEGADLCETNDLQHLEERLEQSITEMDSRITSSVESIKNDVKDIQAKIDFILGTFVPSPTLPPTKLPTPVQTLIPTPTPSCVGEVGAYTYQAIISFVSVSSARECCEECKQNLECEKWQYQHVACFLLGSNATPSPSNEWIRGISQ